VIFAWDDWNIEHIAAHDVEPAEAQYVLEHAGPPFPREIGNEKSLVWGQTADGRYLQVVFTYRSDEEIDYESLTVADLMALEAGDVPVVYVIHAMEMTPKMKRQYRRQTR
jgi:uncharacterized DUF497 family protein